MTHRRRGDLVIDLTSPQGTTSRLLAKRPQDDATYGLDAWPFTSVEFWGENPQGEWTLKISDEKVGKIGLANALNYSLALIRGSDLLRRSFPGCDWTIGLTMSAEIGQRILALFYRTQFCASTLRQSKVLIILVSPF